MNRLLLSTCPAAFARALIRLRVVSREDFIAMTLFAHGPQDLADAEFALAAADDSLDMPLDDYGNVDAN